MTNLTDHDREIVAAAERFVGIHGLYEGDGNTYQQLAKAVQAKWNTKQPRCDAPNYSRNPTDTWNCDAPAVQEVTSSMLHKPLYRCEKHRIKARDL